MFGPVYLVGTLICIGVWVWTRRWAAGRALLLRSIAMSLTFAPGIVVGHGAAVVPAVYVLYFYICDWPDKDWALALVFGLVPLIVAWVVLASVLSLIQSTKAKKSNATPS